MQHSTSDLPSAARLRRATITAIGVAAVLLVTIVMPAEYGKDFTGIGRLLGLTEMGEIKQQLAREAAAAEAAERAAAEAAAGERAPEGTAAASSVADTGETTVSAPTTPVRADTVMVTLAPNEGKEVKLVMREGASARFSWRSTGGAVNFDQHGDSAGAPNSYIGYGRGTRVESDSGTLTAAMDGGHGWFWRNRSGRPVVVRLEVFGAYSEVKRFF